MSGIETYYFIAIKKTSIPLMLFLTYREKYFVLIKDKLIDNIFEFLIKIKNNDITSYNIFASSMKIFNDIDFQT